MKHLLSLAFLCSLSFYSQAQIFRAAQEYINETNVATGHTGILLVDAATNKTIYQHQSNKLFVPASNAKIASMYAALKILGDSSLMGIQSFENDTAVFLFATGDPTFMHDNFENQPVLDYLQSIKKPMYMFSQYWQDNALGYGWAWDDYNGFYMTERSLFPIHGNYVEAHAQSQTTGSVSTITWQTDPQFFKSSFETTYNRNSYLNYNNYAHWYPQRNILENTWKMVPENSKFTDDKLPFATKGINTTLEVLRFDYNVKIKELKENTQKIKPNKIIYSQAIDSLLKPMMQRSDNFFAEQILLMSSHKKFGVLNNEKIIDEVKDKYLKGKTILPKWVDGSGLSRYNLFSPQTFVYMLKDMYASYDFNRLKTIFPTGGTGTLKSSYGNLRNKIFAKTGTLSNHVGLSGYLITKSNKVIIFSILNNNFMGSPGPIRAATEKFLNAVYNLY